MRKLFLFVLLFGCTALLPAQPSGNTFLWRIYKPGMKKPSYLFGTMHVANARAFNFKDSLYAGIEQTDAFAMEVHPDSFNLVYQAYIRGEAEDEETGFLSGIQKNKEQRDQLEKSLDKKTIRLIREKFKEELKDKKLTDEELTEFVLDKFLERKKKKKKEEFMNTFMDAFLYTLASQQGKEIIGLESATMQIRLGDPLERGFRYENFNTLIQIWDFAEESPIHAMYYREKFDSINLYYSLFYDTTALEKMLYRRNRDMVVKIDSLLSASVSLFVAVGAGHLPGEQGMVQLLRKKGYTVDPVFSDKRVAAAEYTKGKTWSRTWHELDNKEYGFRFNVPGVAREEELEKGGRLAYYYDVGGGQVYAVRCGRLSIAEQKRKTETVINAQLMKYCIENDGLPGTKTDIVQSGLKGKETIIRSKDGYIRYRTLLDSTVFYTITVGAERKENLTSADAERFFQSFTLYPVPVSRWQTLESASEGFRVSLPGKPRDEFGEEEAQSTQHVHTYTFFDKHTGINFTTMFIRTMNGNEYIRNTATTHFESYLKELSENYNNKPLDVQDTVINGYPAKLFTTPYHNNGRMKGLLVRRGNTSCYLLAEYDTSSLASTSLDAYFSSFRLLPFKKADWKIQLSAGGGFSVWSPAKVDTMFAADGTPDITEDYERYYVQHPYSSSIFLVTKHALGDYFWARNEDSVYSFIKKSNTNSYTSTVLSWKPVQLPQQKTGRELILRYHSDSSMKRILVLLDGAGYYQLETDLPALPEEEQDMDQFFRSFTITRPLSSELLYTRKPEKLVEDLQSTDSTLHHKALKAMSNVQFNAEDVPLLLSALKKPYPEFSVTYSNAYDKIFDELETLQDQPDAEEVRKQVSRFAYDYYARTDSITEKNRFAFLALLARHKTKESYEQIRQLMSQHLPARGYMYGFYGEVEDSLSLATVFFPEWFNYITDTVNGLPVLNLARILLDSNHLRMEDIKKYSASVLKQAKQQWKKLVKEPEDSYDWRYGVRDMIILLGRLKQPEADAVLNDYLKIKIPDIRIEAVLALVRNDKKVPATILEKLAEQPYYRLELYEELVKLDKLSLLPGPYRTQFKIAESYIEHAATGEDFETGDLEYIYITKKEYTIKGETKLFYLFRANYGTDEETGEAESSYLAIAGPFSTDPADLDIKEEDRICGLYFGEDFNGMKLDKHFKAFVEEWLEWNEKNEEK